jgi:hypothetical protein
MVKKKQFPLRADPDVFAAIEKWASDELRSTNAHIEMLLREALHRAGRMPKLGKNTDASEAPHDAEPNSHE